jgi:hypothetical protein
MGKSATRDLIAGLFVLCARHVMKKEREKAARKKKWVENVTLSISLPWLQSQGTAGF